MTFFVKIMHIVNIFWPKVQAWNFEIDYSKRLKLFLEQATDIRHDLSMNNPWQLLLPVHCDPMQHFYKREPDCFELLQLKHCFLPFHPINSNRWPHNPPDVLFTTTRPSAVKLLPMLSMYIPSALCEHMYSSHTLSTATHLCIWTLLERRFRAMEA